MTGDVLRHYEKAAKTLIAKFEAVSSRDLYAPVIGYLPIAPARFLDVGAGTGRDAAWLSALGHHVTAVEPVKAFRDAGQGLHKGIKAWAGAALPDLESLTLAEQTYDCILLTAVWHHLDAAEQMASARTLSTLLVKGGRLILSIRHEAGSDPNVQTDQAMACFMDAGLACRFQAQAPSRQADNHKAGVFWTWDVFETATSTPALGLTPQSERLPWPSRINAPQEGPTQDEPPMTQRLHFVFGGELIDPTKTAFKDVNDIHMVGIYEDYDTAYNAWKNEAQRTVDNAHMRYFIAHLHRLRDEEAAASSTEELS